LRRPAGVRSFYGDSSTHEPSLVVSDTLLVMRPTTHTEVNDLIRDLLERLQAVLGPDLVGVYLYGSAAAGDFDVKRSDVDLVVVCTSEPGNRFPDLERMRRELSLVHRDWNDRIDIIYVSATTLREWDVCYGR
jgi:predicted nucleotidyltransferase